MKRFLALSELLLVFASPLSFAEFEEVSLCVTILANEDGSAHVREEIRFFMNEPASVEIYDAGSAFQDDITSWKKRTKVDDVRHHFDTNYVDIRNIVIRPQPKDSCDSFFGTCYGTLKMEYDLYPVMENGSVVNRTGIFFANKFKPRTTNYSLNTKALSFEISQTGDIVLPDKTTLLIMIPKDSVVTTLDPLPFDMRNEEFPIIDENSFTWSGRTTLAGFSFEFQREEPLSSEVIEFFSALEERARDLLFSLEGLALLFIIAVAVVSYYLLKKK